MVEKYQHEVKAIIFDLGGVTITSAFDPFSKELELLYGIDKGKVYRLLHKLQDSYFAGKISNKEFWSSFSKNLGIKNDSQRFNMIMLSFYQIIPETFQMIKTLKSKYKLALLSNVSKDWLDFTLEKYPLGEVFDVIIASYMLKSGKPDMTKSKNSGVKPYLTVIKKLKVSPFECIFIDDKKPNLLPAKELGMKAILFRNPKQLKKDLKKLGV